MRRSRISQKSINKEEARVISSLLPRHIINGKKVISFDGINNIPVVLLRTNPNYVGVQRTAKELNQRAEARNKVKTALKNTLEHEYGETVAKNIKISNDNNYYREEYLKIDSSVRIAVSRDERIKASKGCKKVGMQKKIALSYEMQEKTAEQQIEMQKTLAWEQDNKTRINKGLPARTFNQFTSSLCQKKKRKQKY